MRKALPAFVIMLLLAVSCTTAETDAPVMPDAAGETAEPAEEAIFFFTRDEGIVTLERMDGLVYMTSPRMETYLEPMKEYVSLTGEPLFVSSAESVNVKIYRDRVWWSHGGHGEYAVWNFTESPKDFYFIF